MATKHKPIGSFDYKTMAVKLNTKAFKKRFDDGTAITSFEIERIGKKVYFIRKGRDRKGNCHLWAAQVQFTPEGSVIFLDNPGNNATGCIGAPCSACAISPDGTSCRCKRSGRCNHLIITGSHLDFGIFR